MATAARQDDQGNVIQVGEEGAEGEEGEYQDAKGQGAGDDRGQGAPDPRDPPYGGACGCHPLDPLPPDPMDLLGNLVDAVHDASLQANPGHRCRFQQALHRCAQGGILPDPNLNPDADPDDDDTPLVKIPPPIFKGLQEKGLTLTYMPQKTGWKLCVSEKISILTNLNTLNHLAHEWYHSLDRGNFHGD